MRVRSRIRLLASSASPWLAALLVAACGGGHEDPSAQLAQEVALTEERAPCASRDVLRRPFFGDLHVHTALSWDGWGWNVRFTASDAYRFARGEPLALPAPELDGGSRSLQLARPLDFAAVTDHAEYLAEVRTCTDPLSSVFSTERCTIFRQGGFLGQASFGVSLVANSPKRFQAICGRDGIDCRALAGDIWTELARDAEAAYDRSPACTFTSFIAYEWTGANGIANLHRNVIFRNDDVPDIPYSHFDAPIPEILWRTLTRECLDAPGRCDVLAIPHNSNISNGNLFPLVDTAPAELRASLEPLVEIFQHKGDSECRNGFTSLLGAPDELCNFEKFEPADVADCGDGTGIGGSVGVGLGCRSRVDFVRGALLAGLQAEQRSGTNPYPLGFIASTDTHNATPGAVEEKDWPGHHGNTDDEASERLERPGFGNGFAGNPGGLAGVWAEENSRDAIFEALRRRETFGTSGPRIAVRFFGAWQLPEDLCEAPDLVARGYAAGVPMGGVLPSRTGGARAPRFVVSALRDAVDAPLQRIQIVKGWVDTAGEGRVRVFEVAGDPASTAGVDPDSCMPHGRGFDSLCGHWVDPDFRADEGAYYYARVVQNPTCRWSKHLCNSLALDQRPTSCSDGSIAQTIQERAWTSPIWYRPGQRD